MPIERWYSRFHRARVSMRIWSGLGVRFLRNLSPWRRYGADPFLLSLEPARNADRAGGDSLRTDLDYGHVVKLGSGYQLAIHPDGLMVWHWTMAVMLVASTGLIFRGHEQVLLLAGTMTGTYFVLFWIVYRRRRRPVLQRAAQLLPPQLHDWMYGIVERIEVRRSDFELLCQSNRRIDRRLLLLFGKHEGWPSYLSWMRRWRGFRRLRNRYVTQKLGWRRHARQYRNGPEDLLLRAGLADFFRVSDSSHSPGIIRFIQYWCAPIWIGYLVLLIPLFVAFAFPGRVQDDDVGHLIYPLALWMAITMTFFMRLPRQLLGREPRRGESAKRWWVQASELSAMPSVLHEELLAGSRLADVVSGIRFRSMAHVVNTATFGVYVVLMDVLTGIARNLT